MQSLDSLESQQTIRLTIPSLVAASLLPAVQLLEVSSISGERVGCLSSGWMADRLA